MRITRIDIFRLSIPMVPFTIATGTMNYAQNMFIRIHTDEGLTGVGECSAFPMIVGETQDTCMAVAQDFARIWTGKDPLDIAERMAELDQAIARNYTAKSAFDIALYDIAARNAGLPLYAFLGGENRPVETDITIGIGTRDEMAAQAREFVAAGARKLKVKLGKNAQEDVQRIRSIRETIGQSATIRIDANQGYSFDEAKYVLSRLEDYGVEFCEQPMRAWDDALLPELKRVSPIKIMADESVYTWRDARRLCEAGACDYINIKFAKSGGIYGAQQIVDIAKAYAVPCMLGGMLESRIALSAKVHFALANPHIIFHDLDTCLLGHLSDPCEGGVEIRNFQLYVPESPGIGAEAIEKSLTGI